MSDAIVDGYEGSSDPLSEGGGEEAVSLSEAEGSESSLGEELGETEESSASETGEEGQDPQDGEAENAVLSGTPFKSQAALVKGYKDLQRFTSSKDGEIKNLKRQLGIAIEAIQRFSGKSTPKQQEEFTLPQGDAFWQAMAKDPGSFLTKLVQSEAEKLMESKYGSKLQSLESTVGSQQLQVKVQSFVSSHPEFTQEDEDAMVSILEANPHLKDLPDGLEVVYDKVLAQKYRAGSKTARAASAVAGAKTVAGLGGKKTSLPSSAQKRGDPFDDVLALDRADKELYKLGKKA